MAQKPAAKSFDDIIKSDRKKRKAEALAQQIFGKKRDAKQNGNKPERPQSPGGSLASRVGVTKRSASASSVDRQARPARPNPPSSLSRSATAARLESHIAQNDLIPRGPRTSAKTSGKQSRGGEISIRGAAGPYTVVAQNFAPGTTAADIESVMQPIGGDMMSCILVASKPTVIAEMVFIDKQGADNVISTFNNKKADGRLLYVFMKTISEPTDQSMVQDDEVEELGSNQISNGPTQQPIETAPAEAEMEVDVEPSRDSYRQDEPPRRDDYGSRNGRYGGYYDDRGTRPGAYQDNRYGYGQDPRSSGWDHRRDYRAGGGRGGRLYSDDVNRHAGQRRGW